MAQRGAWGGWPCKSYVRTRLSTIGKPAPGGALHVRARSINDEMKIAEARALAALAKEEVCHVVLRAYGLERLRFGADYILPKPVDPRVPLLGGPGGGRGRDGVGGCTPDGRSGRLP